MQELEASTDTKAESLLVLSGPDSQIQKIGRLFEVFAGERIRTLPLSERLEDGRGRPRKCPLAGARETEIEEKICHAEQW